MNGAGLRPLCLMIGGAIFCVYLASFACARGARTFFSVQTLESQGQSEWLLPLTEIPIYRSPRRVSRYRLVEFLIEEGYWSPIPADRPPIVTNHWNRQWRDGQSDFHRQFAWRADFWIEWTRTHRDLAAELWPAVLRELRSGSAESASNVSQWMATARLAESLEEFHAKVGANPQWQDVTEATK